MLAVSDVGPRASLKELQTAAGWTQVQRGVAHGIFKRVALLTPPHTNRLSEIAPTGLASAALSTQLARLLVAELVKKHNLLNTALDSLRVVDNQTP